MEISPACGSIWRRLDDAPAAVGHALDEALREEHGISLVTYDALSWIAAAEEARVPMTELRRGVPLTKSGLTRLVDRLEAAGLVERRECAADRRITYAALTAEGGLLVKRAAPTFERVLDEEIRTRLPTRQLELLDRALGSLADGRPDC
jgi:DNA-binding MarR family transcriptional regulator